MTKIASNAGKEGEAPATSTSTNPGQATNSQADQGEVPVVATNRCVCKRRRGVAGDPIPFETLKVLKEMSKDIKTMKQDMKTANRRLEIIEENSKPPSRFLEVLKTMGELVTLVKAFFN